MSHVTGTVCLSCQSRYSREQDVFTCPACGSNVEVVYDMEAVGRELTRESLAADRRWDIRRYMPLLPLEDPSSLPPLPVGGTPLLAPQRLRAELKLPKLYVKDDTRNPSASFKDRASAVALGHARERKAEIICAASTGNAGSSMACLSASVGQQCVVLVPKTAPRAKVAQLLMFGAQVLAVDGTYDDAFDLSLEASRAWGWYNRNTGTNPYTREGKKTSALEICEQLDWQVPDRVLVSVGDGNIISGLWKGFRDLHACGLIDRLPKMIAVQSTLSDAICRTVEKVEAAGGQLDPASLEVEQVRATTLADSISVDLPRDGLAAVRAVVESGGEAVAVSDEAILAAMGRLARSTGLFAEPAGVTGFAGLLAMHEAGKLDPEQSVVVLATGSGLKDVASALKAVGEPTVVAPELPAVARALGR